MRVAAVILAAGGSTRLGQPKQLLVTGGETLVESAVRAAREAGCKPVLVVTGAVPLSTTGVAIANAEWEQGIGTSIRCGVQHIAAQQPTPDAVLLLTCDQPLVDAELLRTLITTRQATGKPIVASSYAGTLGIPALFDRSCWEELGRLPNESGAKPIITSDPTRVAGVPFVGGEIDIDTPADLARLR
jgi:molybdenum cofactor cytidylyltransferase